MSPTDLRRAVLLSAQRALVGMITADCCGVFVSWEQPERINIQFFVSTPDVSEDAWEAANLVHTYVLADFPDGDVSWDIKSWDRGSLGSAYPAGAWAFLRSGFSENGPSY